MIFEPVYGLVVNIEIKYMSELFLIIPEEPLIY